MRQIETAICVVLMLAFAVLALLLAVSATEYGWYIWHRFGLV